MQNHPFVLSPVRDETAAYILAVLRDRVGSANAITAAELAAKVSAFEGRKVDGREIRDTIHNLRTSQAICSGPAGFFWPASSQDVFQTADVEFRSEARSMLLTARKLREAGRRMFGNQGRLF